MTKWKLRILILMFLLLPGDGRYCYRCSYVHKTKKTASCLNLNFSSKLHQFNCRERYCVTTVINYRTRLVFRNCMSKKTKKYLEWKLPGYIYSTVCETNLCNNQSLSEFLSLDDDYGYVYDREGEYSIENDW